MKKVMIVDDNYLNAEGIEKNIDWKALDAEVSSVKYDSRSALDAMRENPVDLIISDIEMPDLDGISMSKLALSLNPLVKIILVSAYDKFEYARRAIRLGIFDYIEKPLDYAYLTEKIQNAFQEIERTQKNTDLVNASRPLMTEKFFNDLLHYPGENPAAHLKQYLQYLDLQFDYDFFCVMILETEKVTEKDTSGLTDTDSDFSRYQIELLNVLDLLKEKLNIFNGTFYLKGFQDIVCIIGQDTGHSIPFLQSVHRQAEAITDQYQNHMLSLNIGIGNIVNSLWKLPVSFASASHALKYRFFFPQKNIFDAKEALGKEFSLLSFSENTEEELIRLICSKDITAIRSWLADYFQRLLSEIQDKNLVFVRIYSLLGKILKFLYEMNLDTDDLEKEIIQIYTHFDSFHTYKQFADWMTTLCSQVCQKLDTSLQSYHNQVYNVALSYIKQNFENSSLCLNDIAHHANISPAYLSSLFKKVSGQSISDTISGLRMESACHYLASGNLSLKEISLKCGYANQYYLDRKSVV